MPALIIASLLSAYAALWFLERLSLDSLLFKHGLYAFAFAVLALFCFLASLSGIAQAWRVRNSSRAPGEALLGFILMLGAMLFTYLLGMLT